MLEMIRTHNKQISKKDALDQCVEMLKRVGTVSGAEDQRISPSAFGGDAAAGHDRHGASV